MTVYHGSFKVVRNPDVLHSFRQLDFGKGFYVTTVRAQAEIGDKARAIAEISAYPNYDQIAFVTQKAMDFYYNSRLADKIATGTYGMQYLDYKVLAQLIMETEEAR